MQRRNLHQKQKNGARPQRGLPPAMGQFDFGPILPFLTTRVAEHHPVYKAAITNDLAAFMAALRDVGDGRLNHDIASELERISRNTPPS